MKPSDPFWPKGYNDAEVTGKDRNDAVAHLWIHLDSVPGTRRKPAAQAFRVVRVRRLGPRWWSVRYAKARRTPK